MPARTIPNGSARASTLADTDEALHRVGMDRPVNVLSEPLQPCGRDPVTGFFRDGYCNTGPYDLGSHTVAAVVTDRWLEFSAGRGNDLRSILRGGQAWCLCAERWTEAVDAWRAGELQKEDVPKVNLAATHIRALEYVDLDTLRQFAL